MVNDFSAIYLFHDFNLIKLYMLSLDYLTKELELDINVNVNSNNNGK